MIHAYQQDLFCCGFSGFFLRSFFTVGKFYNFRFTATWWTNYQNGTVRRHQRRDILEFERTHFQVVTNLQLADINCQLRWKYAGESAYRELTQ